MEYQRSVDGQIHEDFARRAGRLLIQYEQLSRGLNPVDTYEATLCIALLQPLLTIAAERLNSNKYKNSYLRKLANLSVDEEPHRIGFSPDCIREQWPSVRPLSYRDILFGIRHSLSHPLPQKSTPFRVTGFTSYSTQDGEISGYEFVHSPFVSPTGLNLKGHYCIDASAGPAHREELDKQLKKWRTEYQVESLSIQPRIDRPSLAIHRGSDLFVPCLCLNMSVKMLRTFTLALSEIIGESSEVPQHNLWAADIVGSCNV